ncbi:MAG: sulfite exporter TauE/SafE family protein [Oscillospiraceae bacterium]|nr:sulfite exporter TauE/SafE family protein [Oscillospiraceae bacterium]
MTILTFITALISGFLASLGVGGGSVLIIWLTSFCGVDQLEAQGTNLIFFISIALMSVIIHRKNGLIEIKKLIPTILLGIVGAICGTFAAQWLGYIMLRKIFGGFIIIIGICSLFSKKSEEE